MEYKNYTIEKHSYHRFGYEAYHNTDEEASVLYGRTLEEIITEIDEQQ